MYHAADRTAIVTDIITESWRGYVWQVIHSTRWGEIVAKGKYLIAALVKEKKKSGC